MIKTLAAAAALSLTTLALAAPAAAQPAGGPSQCFRLDQIQRREAQGDSRMLLYLRRKEVVAVDFAGSCRSAGRPFTALVLEPKPSTGRICSALDLNPVRLTDTSTGFSEPCIAQDLRRLTPAEVAALPRRLRPR